MISRRSFLLTSTAAAASIRNFAQSGGSPSTAILTLRPELPLARVPKNFMGLSYEVQQLADPSFFSESNKELITLFHDLSPSGVLRLGGNTSDSAWWKGHPEETAPIPPPRTGTRPGNAGFPIEPQAITNLRGFLNATGWTCLFGLNLGSNTPERAAEQAVFVSQALGPKLEYFKLGNEPDFYAILGRRDRATWTADAYFDDWLAMAHAIQSKVPNARFGLPDTTNHVSWFATLVKRLIALPPDQRPNVYALTHHYYFGTPPSNPDVNIVHMLQHSKLVDQLAHDIRTAAEELSSATHQTVVYRMTEGNTCARGGKPGLSDVFASALWAADYCLLLASEGYAGVNLQGGSATEVANSVGGRLAGDALIADPSVPHPRPFYTPIATMNGKYVAEPVYQGMLFAQQFAGAQIISLGFNAGTVNATAYASVMPDGTKRIAVINKDAYQSITFRVPGISAACTMSLTGPALDSQQTEWNARPSGRGEGCEAKGNGQNVFTAPPRTALLIEGR